MHVSVELITASPSAYLAVVVPLVGGQIGGQWVEAAVPAVLSAYLLEVHLEGDC